jgi:hypothetical protein
MYVGEDRNAGNFAVDGSAQHPRVTSVAEMWGALKPFRLTLTDHAKEYNAIIWLDVEWPNPHCFVAFFDDDELYLLDVEG